MDPANEHFAVGTADGLVRMYDMTEENGYRQLHTVDVAKILKKRREALEEQMKAEADSGTLSIIMSNMSCAALRVAALHCVVLLNLRQYAQPIACMNTAVRMFVQIRLFFLMS